MLNRSNLYYKINLNNLTVKRLNYISLYGLNMELAVTDTSFLYEKFAEIGNPIKETITDKQAKTIMHLPFYGIQLGCADPYIRELSLKLVLKAIERGLELGIHKGVMHIAVPSNLPRKGEKRWMKTFFRSLEMILTFCKEKKFAIYLENSWEKKLTLIEDVFAEFDDEHLAICLDIAHVYCFSGLDFSDWWTAFSTKIRHIHLSDNNFDEDSHLPLGQGSIDYATILRYIDKEERQDLTFTLETDIQELLSSLDYLVSNGLYIAE